MDAPVNLRRTPLYDLHISLQAKMVPFAGYAMPVQYPAGIIREHLHTRQSAGLFDISHMGQIALRGKNLAQKLERIMPGDFQELAPGQIRYSFLLNEQGGVIDDLMVMRGPAGFEDDFSIIVNASCKENDFAHIAKLDAETQLLEDRALLALQGPKAAQMLAKFCDAPQKLKFMEGGHFTADGNIFFITRSGYTGEDGFEISVPVGMAEKFARALLAQEGVAPIGLGARDSLRLEAGLCLYGHDLNETITPIEAGLSWAIGKRRRKEGGFTGAGKILGQMAEGVTRKRVGIRPESRALAREHTDILDSQGRKIGIVTSGGFGPSVDGPVCMGYVEPAFVAPGTDIALLVRGKALPAKIAPLPFVPHRYVKG